MRFGPGNESFEHGNIAPRVMLCMAERPQSLNVPMKKSNSQRLKKSKSSLLSGIRCLQSNRIFR